MCASESILLCVVSESSNSSSPYMPSCCLQGVTRFKAKIGDANSASQKLFHSLGYIQTGRSEVFQEITLELAAAADEAAGGTEDPSAWQALLELGAQLEKGVYDS